MPKFLDLATELILAITSYIPKSADRLQLALVNRELYHIIIPQLYRHITLGRAGDSSDLGDYTLIRRDTC